MSGPASDAGRSPDTPDDLAAFIRQHGIEAEFVQPGVLMPTVDTAAAAIGVSPQQIFKSLLFQSLAERCVLVVACGHARVDTRRVGEVTGIRGLRLARPEVVLMRTGYPAGGTPPIGHREKLPVVVDTQVAEQAWGFGGGGRPEWLLKIRSPDIIRLTGALVADVTRNDQ